MSRALNKLTAAKIKAERQKNATQKLFDGGGLYLHIKPPGSYWRLKYRLGGKEKTLAIGVYPEISLKEARERRDEAKQLIKQGLDPILEQRARKGVSSAEHETFEAIAQEWWEDVHTKKVYSQSYAHKNQRHFVRHIYPYIGQYPCDAITPTIVLSLLRRLEKNGHAVTAHRVKNLISQVFRYAIATERAAADPTQSLKGAIATPRTQHMAAVTDEKQLGELLGMFESYTGPVVGAALRLAPLVFVRPGELRTAKWEQIDFEQAEWRYRMGKTRTEHIVPLAKQSLAILEELQTVTGHGVYVFPSARSPRGDRPMSDNAVLAALRSLEIPKDVTTGHGFRATARTLLDEKLKYPAHLIEHQLGHVVRDPLGRAYNRTKHMDERREMMQAWADYLDGLK